MLEIRRNHRYRDNSAPFVVIIPRSPVPVDSSDAMQNLVGQRVALELVFHAAAVKQFEKFDEKSFVTVGTK